MEHSIEAQMALAWITEGSCQRQRMDPGFKIPKAWHEIKAEVGDNLDDNRLIYFVGHRLSGHKDNAEVPNAPLSADELFAQSQVTNAPETFLEAIDPEEE